MFKFALSVVDGPTRSRNFRFSYTEVDFQSICNFITQILTLFIFLKIPKYPSTTTVDTSQQHLLKREREIVENRLQNNKSNNCEKERISNARIPLTATVSHETITWKNFIHCNLVICLDLSDLAHWLRFLYVSFVLSTEHFESPSDHYHPSRTAYSEVVVCVNIRKTCSCQLSLSVFSACSKHKTLHPQKLWLTEKSLPPYSTNTVTAAMSKHRSSSRICCQLPWF